MRLHIVPLRIKDVQLICCIYLISNYDVLGDDQIKLNSGKYHGKEWYEVHVPITLSGENIETEFSENNPDTIWSIDFTVQLMEYVKEM